MEVATQLTKFIKIQLVKGFILRPLYLLIYQLISQMKFSEIIYQ